MRKTGCRIISTAMLAIMLFAMIITALPIGVGAATGALTFKSGFDDLYISKRDLATRPYTFEARTSSMIIARSFLV